MSFRSSSDLLRKSILLVAVMMVPAFVWGQQKKTSPPPPKPSAPASKPAAPAKPASKPAAPSSSHTSAPGGNKTGTSAGRPGAPSSGKTGTSAGKPGAPATGKTGTSAGRPGTPGTTGGKPATAMSKPAPGRTPPGKQISLKGGGLASIRPNGQIRSVDRNGMHIQRGLSGQRKIESTRNGARVVSVGKHGGYVQRNYVSRNGRTYVSRTYVVNNVTYTSVYRSYGYGGYCCYYGYAPAYYYQPVYYGWAYNPWPAPAYYNWGWGGAPWYGYYGPYYQPYPVYPSAYFWLTDYMIAASLQAAYAAQVEASGSLLDPSKPDFLVASLAVLAPPAESNVALTPEVKNAIAEEVKATLADEQSEAEKKKAGTSAPSGQQDNAPLPALDAKRKTFVVSSEVTMVVDSQECSLTQGDVITRTSDTPDDDKNVTVKVAASKKSDCAVGKEGTVALDDLQEMYNKFREQVAGGMKSLSEKSGKDGLPKAPDTTTTDGEIPAPAADTTAAKALQDQQSAADQTESQVKAEAGSGSGGQQ